MKHSFLILSPGLSQSVAIARLLRTHLPEARLLAGVMAGDRSRNKVLYDEVRHIDFENPVSFEDLAIIPTGAIVTQRFCGLQPCFRLGDVDFSADNLRVGDKKWMLDCARNLSVPVPETWERFEQLPDNGHPVFYKPMQEAGGSLRRMAADKSGVPHIARGSDYLFQEYIDTPGTYGFAFIAKDGNILCSQQHFEKRSDPKEGGSASVIEVFDDQRIADYSKRMIKELDYSGWGLVEFKYCARRKDYVLMEINAKFWASLEFTLRHQPGFASLLFGIETQKTVHQGLVWPSRLLASGPGSFMMSINDLHRYPWIFESGDMRRVAAGWTPDFLKKYIKALISQ